MRLTKKIYLPLMKRIICSPIFALLHPELKKEIEYVKKKGCEVFPYDFNDDYKPSNYTAFMDDSCDLPYVLHDGKKLYFHKKWGGVDGAAFMYSTLRKEQDINSPHRYFTETFSAQEDEVLIDVGSAEGMEALELVDAVKHIYMFEFSDKWLAPLRKTFENYSSKVTIIPKMVSNRSGDQYSRIDEAIGPEHRNKVIMKLDVEGMELDVLKSAETLIQNASDIKILVCTYHKTEDAKVLWNWLVEKGFECEFSDGYMLFNSVSDHKYPYFRKGLIRAKKTTK